MTQYPQSRQNRESSKRLFESHEDVRYYLGVEAKILLKWLKILSETLSNEEDLTNNRMTIMSYSKEN